MRRALGLLALILSLALTACAGLPTSGPVQPGSAPDETDSSADFALVPDRPQAGASPEQIVDGFIRAGSGPGPTGDWATAKLFLTDELATRWTPTAGVIIDEFDDRGFVSTSQSTVSMTVTPAARVDDTGAYQLAEGGQIVLPFELEQQDDGQWRISEAPDGIVLYQEVFSSVYNPVSVQFFDPGWRYLVPDVRWFPQATAAALITQAVVGGAPSPWLARAVNTAFPEDVTWVGNTTLPDGVVQVELGESALPLDATTLGRMQAQLQRSLESVGVGAVQMTAGGTPLTAPAAAVRSTGVNPRPLIERDGVFGFLAGDTLETIPGLSTGIVALNAVAVEVGADRDAAAVLTAAGAVARVDGDGSTSVLDAARAGLIAPTLDADGYVWSVPRGEPAAIQAYSPDGDVSTVATNWPGVTAVPAFALSRDGSRLAAVVATGGQTEIWVSGVERAADGTPRALTDHLVVAETVASGVDISWLDDTTLSVLLRTGEDLAVLEQSVGGRGATVPVPADVTTVVGGNASIRLLSAAQVLYLEQGSNWQRSATGVRLLATQQGAPQ